MIWKLAFSYLGSYWREVAIVVLCGVVVKSCHDRDNAIRADQHSKDVAAQTAGQLRASDSTNAVLRDSIRQVSDSIVTDSVRVVHWLTRTDTLEQWRHDTITVNGVPSFPVPVARVDSDDAGKAACRDLLMDCATFRRFAVQKFANDSGTIKTLRDHPITIQTSCTASNVVSSILGGGVGFTAGFFLHR